MIKLNLGCGLWLKKNFINVDKYYTEEQLRGKKGLFKQAVIESNAKFVQADIGRMPFPDNYADYIEMNQVIEHFPMRMMYTYLHEVHRVMKPGGRLVATMPSFNGVITEWLDMLANPPFDPEKYLDLAEVFYGNQLADGEMHRTPITPEFINWILTQVGFKIGKVYIARKGSKVSDVKFLDKGCFHKKQKAVFRNDNIIIDIQK